MATSIDTCSVTSELELNVSYISKRLKIYYIARLIYLKRFYIAVKLGRNIKMCGTTVRTQRNETTGYGVKILQNTESVRWAARKWNPTTTTKADYKQPGLYSSHEPLNQQE
jgi:hypothetical protein